MAVNLDEILALWEPHKGLLHPPPEAVQLWSAQSRTLFLDNEWGPAIPYRPVDHADGNRNHGYIKLKSDSAATAGIPEVQGWPELRSFLETVNAPGSPIESVGCEKGFFPVASEGDSTVQLGSYVDIIYSDAPLNARPEAFLKLVCQFMDALEGCEQWWGAVEIGLQRLRALAGVESPWGLTIKVVNYGRTEQEARHFWGESLRRLGAAIAALPQDFAQEG